MGLEKSRRKLQVPSIAIGADTEIVRVSANVVGLAVGDRLDLSRGTAQLLINNATTVIGTANLAAQNGAVALRQAAAGSPCVAVRLGGTVFALHFPTAGGAVTGTPVTA